MSLFDQDIVKKSDDWANEELYTRSNQICLVTRRPAWIERKTDHKTYHTVYSLYKEYMDMAEYRFAREMFIKIVKKECPDTVQYRNTTYYSWWWFYDNFVDTHKDSYCF
jgi:hypothetical protein